MPAIAGTEYASHNGDLEYSRDLKAIGEAGVQLLTGQEIVSSLEELGITHVVWLPDTDLGTWENAFEESSLTLLRICREGEAWPLAAGLYLGGVNAVIVIQTTGLFESGDAMRNVLYDLDVPVLAIVGARNWLNADSTDSAKRFAQPVLDAWGIPYVLIETADERTKLNAHFRHCRDAKTPGVVLLAE